MILSHLHQCKDYLGIHPNLDKALCWMADADFSQLPDGQILIDGQDVRVKISTMETKSVSQAKPEAHREFLDIQLLLHGREAYQVAFLDEMQEMEARPEQDVWFYTGPCRQMELDPGQFLVVFPDDVHAPGLAPEEPAPIRKAVFKIRYQ